MGGKLNEGPSSQVNQQIWRSLHQICWSKYLISRLKKSQDYVSLEISKKRGLSINPDIHQSKVPSSVVPLLALIGTTYLC